MRTSISSTNEKNVISYNPNLKLNYKSTLLDSYKSIKPNLALKLPDLPEILFITSYPPRECGIATYSQDLRNAIKEKFGNTFSLKVCSLESKESNFNYPDEVKYNLNTQDKNHTEYWQEK